MDILRMSMAASVLIIFTIAFRFLFKTILPKNILMALWGIVSCKLMIPASILGSYELTFSEKATAPLELTPLLDIPAGIYQAAGGSGPVNTLLIQQIWLVGMAVMALYFLCCYVHCVRMFRISMPLEESPYIAQWLLKKRLRRHISVRISDQIMSPMTYGIIHPVILLPKIMDWNNRERLYYVLEHELSHIRRQDGFWKIWFAAVLVCHWFNPLVYAMYFIANRDMELACDEKVTQTLSRKQCAAYATMLVEWSAQKTDRNPMASHLMQYFMEERIINIMKKRKFGIAGIMLSIALIAGAATVYAATPVTAQTPAFNHSTDDLTLGGIFELYTPEEYKQVVENVKKYSNASTFSQDIKAMEEDLAKLKADNGKGEFIIYKSSFKTTETVNGSSITVGFNPTIVMAPELVKRDIPLTAENYRRDIESVTPTFDQAVREGQLTSSQRQTILNKMMENLAALE